MEVKYRGWFWIFMTALVVVWTSLPAWAKDEQGAATKVAVVNGSVITREEFNREVGLVRQRLATLGKSLSDSQLLEMRKEVLESLINRELLFQDSQTKGIKIDEAKINEQLQALKKRFPNEEEFKKILARMHLSEEAIKSQIERRLAIEKHVGKEFSEKVSITGKETRKYYDSHPQSFRRAEQVHARRILIKLDPSADETQKASARKQIEGIQQKVKRGEDFASLAKEFSQGPSSAKGGDLGYFRRGQMVKPFEEAAFALKAGEVSDVVETRFGYHLIKVIDKKPETTIPYDNVEEELRKYLKQKKIQEQVNAYIEELKGRAHVERFLTVLSK